MLFNPLCPKCESKNTEFLQAIQMRASDEPPTLFYKCEDCGKKFREG